MTDDLRNLGHGNTHADDSALCEARFVDASRGPLGYLCELPSRHPGPHEAPSVGARSSGVAELTGNDAAARFHPDTWRTHPHAKICPHCLESCSRAGITKLVYTFEVCECGDPEYDHLVEQLWHRACFLADRTVRP